jgi:hypothetical protein
MTKCARILSALPRNLNLKNPNTTQEPIDSITPPQFAGPKWYLWITVRTTLLTALITRFPAALERLTCADFNAMATDW